MSKGNEEKEYFLAGFIIGVVLTILIWFFVADEVERCKVNAGYLTYQHETYQVTLYDTLDTPEKPKEK